MIYYFIEIILTHYIVFVIFKRNNVGATNKRFDYFNALKEYYHFTFPTS